jgi:hypothetical protein
MIRRPTRALLLAAALLAAPAAVRAQQETAPQAAEPQAPPAELQARPEQPGEEAAAPGNAPAAQAQRQAPAGARPEPRYEDVPFREAPQATAQPVSALLGRTTWFDALMLLAAALSGALVALLSSWSRSAERAHRHIASLSRRLTQLESDLRARPMHGTAERSGEAPRYEPVDTRRRSVSNPLSAGEYRPDRDSPPVQAPAPPAPREDHRRAAGLESAVASYAKLVATKGSKPRQFHEILAQFPETRALRFDPATGIAAEAFRGDDANQFVVAVGDGRRFAVLPTYEYVSDFSIAFSSQVQNPEQIRQLFEFEADESGQLRVERPAEVEIDEFGAVHIRRRGRLSGFRA